MKQYAAVVFDWDGTVMDSTPSIVRAIQSACADLSLPVPSDQQAAWVIGLSLESALLHCVPTLSSGQMPDFLARYRHHFLGLDPHIELFDGVPALLESLRARQVPLAVATGKSRVGLDRVLAGTKLGHHFHVTRCADEALSKPDPAMLHDILAVLGLAPEQVLMVGDTTHDIQMAASAGMDSMAVTYGAHDEQTLAQARPTVMVSSVAEMRGWLMDRTQG